jgi:hypothetical protein
LRALLASPSLFSFAGSVAAEGGFASTGGVRSALAGALWLPVALGAAGPVVGSGGALGTAVAAAGAGTGVESTGKDAGPPVMPDAGTVCTAGGGAVAVVSTAGISPPMPVMPCAAGADGAAGIGGGVSEATVEAGASVIRGEDGTSTAADGADAATSAAASCTAIGCGAAEPASDVAAAGTAAAVRAGDGAALATAVLVRFGADLRCLDT